MPVGTIVVPATPALSGPNAEAGGLLLILYVATFNANHKPSAGTLVSFCLQCGYGAPFCENVLCGGGVIFF